MTGRPRILLEALQVRERPTGPGTAILELCRGLAAHDRGCDFTVAASTPAMFAEFAGRPGWTVVDCPGARGGAARRAWFLQWGIPRLARSLGADLVHCLQFLAPSSCPVPLVTSVYDLAWLDHPETIELVRRAYYRWTVPRAIRGSRLVLAPSRATAGDVARHFPAAAERVRTVPLGTPTWASGARPVADSAGGPFLFVGALEPRKNLARLLDAYAGLLDERGPGGWPDLVLAGPRGWRDGPIRRRLEELAPTGKVIERGYCSRADLSALYEEALALVFPSLHEGFGLPILEAMSRGVPVLTADRGAPAEVAGEAALLVDPGDTADLARGLARLADDSGLRRRLARSGPDRAEAFTWEETAARTVVAYEEIVGGGAAK